MTERTEWIIIERQKSDLEDFVLDKQQMLKLLIEKGYSAYIENHILMVRYFDQKSPLEEVKKILKENGYNASFGVQRSKSIAAYQPEEDEVAKAV